MFLCMATTKDLSALLDREMGKGQGPFLVRIFQDAEILPRVKRGGFRKMVDLTPEHLADVVMALAATRQAGQRTWQAAKAGVERFAPLESLWGRERGFPSLREGLVFFLEQYRDKDVIGEDWDFSWALFIDDVNQPAAEFRFFRGEAEEAEQMPVYWFDPDGDLEAEPTPVRGAAVIEGEFLQTLAAMIRKVDAEAEDATA